MFHFEKLLFVCICALCIWQFIIDLETKSSYFWTADYDDVELLQAMGVCLLGYIADYSVLGWHRRHPPHPKFRLRPIRKFCIVTHIIGGSIELLCFAVAFFASDPELFATVAAIAALALHVPSSYYQMPICFGQKKFIVPGYILFITFHMITSVQVLQNPTDLRTLVKMCIALHCYVWVRVSNYFFKLFGVQKDFQYTLACLFSIFLSTPLMFGPASNFLHAFGFILFHFMGPLLVRWNIAPWAEDIMEHDRETVITDKRRLNQALLVIAKHSAGSDVADDKKIEVLSNREVAKTLFDAIDGNTDDKLSPDEMAPFLNDAGFSNQQIKAKIRACDQDHSGRVSFVEFYDYFWAVLEADKKILLLEKVFTVVKFNPAKKLPSHEQAKLIFRALDVDDSGMLDINELGDILVAWGLPRSEVVKYMELYDKDGDTKISLEEFEASCAPMWRYAYALLEEEIIYDRTIVERQNSSRMKLD